MTVKEKRKEVESALNRALQIVTKYKTPYNNNTWRNFILKMDSILNNISDKPTQEIVYRIMSSVAEYCNKNLTEEVDE